MKNRMFKKVISWILCFSLVFCNMQVVAFASEFDGGSNSNGENEFVSSTFEFISSQFFNYELRSKFYYTDDYFKNPASVYDDHMATMSLNLALTSFASYYYDVKERSANARELFGKIGFNNVTPNNDYLQPPRTDTMGVICANKHIYVKEGTDVREYNLIAVSMRSSNYRNEWASNFKIGASGDHTGFTEARDIAYSHVSSFYNAHKNDFGNIPTKFWIVGWSRGAACANMLGGKITDEATAFNTTQDNIYVYAFSTPQGANISVHPNLTSYTNIHNIINPQDPVPKVAMSYFGFSRYGIDHFLPTYKSENVHDATKRAEAQAGNTDYMNKKPYVEKNLNLLDPSLKMTCENFLVKDLTLMGQGGMFYLTNRGDKPFTDESKERDFYKQGEFFDSFGDFLARDVLGSNYPGSSYQSSGRQRYYDYFQGPAMKLSETFLTFDEEAINTFAEKLKNNIGKNNGALLQAGMSIVLCVSNNYPRNQTVYDNIGNFLATILTGIISNEDVQYIRDNRQAIVDLLLDILIADTKVADRTISGSIYGNPFTFTEGHGPEYLLSWLQYIDSYYTTPPADTDYDEGYKSITFSNIANTTINVYVGTELKGYITADSSGNFVEHRDDDSVIFRMIRLLNPVSYELQVGQAYNYTIEIIPSVDTTYNSFGYHDKFEQDATSYRNIFTLNDLKVLSGEKIVVDLTSNHAESVSMVNPWNKIPAPRKPYFKTIKLDNQEYGYGRDEFPFSRLPKITKSIKIDGKILREGTSTEVPAAGNFDNSYFINQDAVKEDIDLSGVVYKEIDLQRKEKAYLVVKNNVSAGYAGIKTYNDFDSDTRTATEMEYNDYSIYAIDPSNPKGVDHVLTVNNVTSTTSPGIFGETTSTQAIETEPESDPETTVESESTRESVEETTIESSAESTAESVEESESTIESIEETTIESSEESTTESVEESTEESTEESETTIESENATENSEETTIESSEESTTEESETSVETTEEGMVSGFTGTEPNSVKYTIAVPNGHALNASSNKIMYAAVGNNIKLVITNVPMGKKLKAIKIVKESGAEQQVTATLNTPINYVMTSDNIYIKPVVEDEKHTVTFNGKTYAKLYDENGNELQSGVKLPMEKEIVAKAPWFTTDDKKFFGWTFIRGDGKLLNDKELMSTVYINESDETYNACSFLIPNYDISITAHYVDATDEEKEENQKTVTYDNGQEVMTKKYYIGNAVGLVARATLSELPLQSFKIEYGSTSYNILPSEESYYEGNYEYKGGSFQMPGYDVKVKAIFSKDPPPKPVPPKPTPVNPGGGDSSGGSDSVKPPAGFKQGDDNGSLSWNGGGVIWRVFDKDKNDYVKNSWVNLYYNGKQKWYYFGEDGTMKVGWITHNNNIYFLQITYNDTFGAMLTGIQNIDGVVYEFSNTGELIRVIEG